MVSPLDRETTIGFTDTTKCGYANLWTQYFWEYLCQGYTVSQSCGGASYKVNTDFNNDYTAGIIEKETYDEGHGLDSYVIYGNEHLVFEW